MLDCKGKDNLSDGKAFCHKTSLLQLLQWSARCYAMQTSQLFSYIRFTFATAELLDQDTIVCQPESNDSEATTKDIDRKLVMLYFIDERERRLR
jgi:hypothetical protein